MNRSPSDRFQGDRGGRDGHGRDDRRKGPPPGPKGQVEQAMLETSRNLDKPLQAADYALQGQLLSTLRIQVAKARLGPLAGFEFDPRTKLLTSLVRVGRQTPPAADAPEERLAAWKAMHGQLGGLWKAFGEEERAAKAFAEAGDIRAADLLVEQGDWQSAAQLHVAQGRHREALQLFKAHGDQAGMAKSLEALGQKPEAVTAWIQAKQPLEARRLLRDLATAEAQKLLLALGAGDLLLDLLAARGRWEEIGRLYRRSGQHGDAAEAFLKGGRTHLAIKAFREAGLESRALDVIHAEAKEAFEKGGVVQQASTLGRWEQHAEAAALLAEAEPSKALFHARRAQDQAEVRQLAQRRAAASRESGAHALAGEWLEVAGETDAAIEAFEAGEAWEQALRLLEQAASWERAARLAERAGLSERAAELFDRAKLHDDARRLRTPAS